MFSLVHNRHETTAAQPKQLHSSNVAPQTACCLQEAPQANSSSLAAREVDWLMTFLVFVFPAVGGLLFGYDIGATSRALVSITSERTSGTDW